MLRKFWRWVAEHWVFSLGLLLLGYLFVPIVVVMLLSFNQPGSRNTTYVLDLRTFDFTWNNWSDICGAANLCDSLTRSIYIGLTATLISTILGTLISFALVRYRFAGRSATNILIFLPMATPEIVMGTSLLTLFVSTQTPMGFLTILIAHVMFCISFVVVTVKARLAGLDPRLQEAAMDLYATPWQAFRLVILPLVLPGIVAAALLAFSLSFDDFIITNFATGTSDYITFPMFIWGANLRGIPPQVNAIATAMFLISFAFVIMGQLRTRRRSARRAATS
jgi:spermidine/putrescine transport system permease protein